MIEKEINGIVTNSNNILDEDNNYMWFYTHKILNFYNILCIYKII